MPRRGPPDRLVVELEEVDRSLEWWRTPPLLAVRPGLHQIGERDPHDAVDLDDVRLQHRTFDHRPDDRHDVAPADHRGDVVELTVHADQLRIERDLFPGLAQRGVRWCLVRVHASTGKADLAAMVAHVHRPAGEQQLRTIVAFVQQHEHGRVSSVRERRCQTSRAARTHQASDLSGGRPIGSMGDVAPRGRSAGSPCSGSRDVLDTSGSAGDGLH